MKEVYANFEGQTIAGELVPTQDQIRKLPAGPEYINAHPFVKKACADCTYSEAVLSWWCRNTDAIKARGTRRAGCIFCPFWEPDWRQIPKKYKIAEYGYVPPIQLINKFKNWIKSWLTKK